MDDEPFTDYTRQKINPEFKYSFIVKVTVYGFYVKSGHKFNDEIISLLLKSPKRIYRIGGRLSRDRELTL